MKLLVVGGGGREHAIIKSLKKNPDVTEIFALPGNAGMAEDATCVRLEQKIFLQLLPLQPKTKSIMQLLHRMIRWSSAV